MLKILFLCASLIFQTLAQQCRNLYECPQVLSAFKISEVYPKFCDEDADLVECPPPPRSIEDRKCLEYSKAVYQYDHSEGEHKDKCTISAIPFIVGGTVTGVNEFPHQALLGDEQSWFCGGSLVSEKFVLTAAHCTLPKPPTRVKLGMHDINQRNNVEREFRVKNIRKHPNYKKPAVYDDIALIELATRVEFTPYIRPVCLPSRTQTKNLNEVTATGYGATSYQGLTSTKLQKVRLPKTQSSICERTYKRFVNELPRGITRQQLCYGGQKGQDTCQGDSGGPLQIPHKNVYCSYIQLGITSVGLKCGEGIPGLYTKVIEYVPWIKSIIW